MKKTQVAILGAGLAGLAAAIECKKKGLDYILIEKENEVGGQLKTEVFNDFILDRGFQVLSTRYPMTKKLLNYKKLNLKFFESGAKCWNKTDSYFFYNPFKHLIKYIQQNDHHIISTKDLLKFSILFSKFIFTTDSYLFKEKEMECIRYFDENFSPKLKEVFLKPFFAGVFLDPELSSSSRLFQYYLKNFLLGNTAMPENGIGEIPKQLLNQCSRNNILFNETIKKVSRKKITTTNLEIKADFIISALNGHVSASLFNFPKPHYHKTQNLYFYSDHKIDNNRLINLNSTPNQHINNFHCVTNINKKASPKGKYLYSFSVINEKKDIHEDVIKKEAITLLGKEVEQWTFLKSFSVNKAVVRQRTSKYQYNSRYNNNSLYFCGDWTLQGSIQGALLSGKKVVDNIYLKIKQ